MLSLEINVILKIYSFRYLNKNTLFFKKQIKGDLICVQQLLGKIKTFILVEIWI